MVPKEIGFNQSETACGLCTGLVLRILCSSAMARDDEIKAAFSSLRRHNLPSKVRLRNNQTARNVYCRCNNDAVFSGGAVVTFPTVAVCRPR